MADIGMALNYTNVYEINTTPGAVEPTWAWVAGGINSVDPDGNENVEQDEYYDGMGMASSDVTGGQQTISFSGHRKYGDPAQDFVASLRYEYGEARKTDFRWTMPDGAVVEAFVTIAEIKAAGGDPNAKSDFEFSVHFNGRPTLTEPTGSDLPESITAEAVTVQVGESAEVGAAVTPTSAGQGMFYAITDEDVAAVTSDGKVTGLAEGTTKLVIRAAAKPSVIQEVDVTVTAAA